MGIDPQLLFSRECRFFSAASSPESIPATQWSEVAFAGRSNVGKSSLVNALTGRRTLARTSSTPGRTRELNFFLLDEKLMLVDLPGYGYAKASKTLVGGWTQLTLDYLRGRQQLQRVFLLIDSRHGLQKNDISTMQKLDDSAVCYQVVLTKADAIGKDAQQKRIQEVEQQLKKFPAALPEVILTSARDKIGIEALREVMARFVG